jgi:prophage regulatory protein
MQPSDFKSVFRRAQVLSVTGLCSSNLYALIAAGEFPRPITLSGVSSRRPAVGWINSEVQAWIEQRIAQRDAQD